MIDQVHRYLEGAWSTLRVLLPLLTLVEVAHARPLASQEPASGRTLVVTLSEAIADSDHDFVPDQLARSLRMTGTAIMVPRVARTGWWYVVIQDEDAGIRLLTADSLVLRGIERGTELSATGVLSHRRGTEELLITEVDLGEATAQPAPRDVLVKDLVGERFMHRLVRVEGVLGDFDPLGSVLFVEDRTGRIEVRVPDRFLTEGGVLGRMEKGGRATVVGILAQSDPTPPLDGGFRLQPRDPHDIQWAPTLPVVEALTFLTFLVLVIVITALWRRRSLAERRVNELGSLTRDLRNSQAQLVASEAHFRAMFETDPVGRFIADSRGVLERWNPSFLRFLDRAPDEMIGVLLVDVLADADDLLEEVHGAGRLDQVEVRPSAPERQGTVGLLSMTLAASDAGMELRGSVVDITHRRELELKLSRAQKMEALGRVAGGVAHDLNNMLSIIIGNTLILMDDCDVEGLLPALEDIQQAANRSAGLTSQLLTLARRDIGRPVLLDLNAVIQDMASGLHRMLGPDIEFVVLLEEGFGMGITMDTSQLEQIILNLVVNAQDAMQKGGKLKIETFECFDAPAALGATAPVRRVGLRVSDTGVGMDKDTLDRLFEPFFTTKEDGTGLGLSTVYGITKQAGGSIEVTSTLGSGSVFELCLPWSGSVPEAARERRSSRPKDPLRLSHSVLLAEDEPGVRAMARRVLEDAGCSVTEARNGDVALRIFSEDPQRFDLLLTDLVMPIMSGQELAQEVEAMETDIPILFMSGYTEDLGFRAEGHLDRAFLQKPFRPAQLVDKVSRVLGVDGVVKEPTL